MARRAMSARRGAVAALAALALALCASPAAGSAGPALLGARTAGADARAVTLPADERAERALPAALGPRKLLLFGLTARDKAAHQEQRDAMIEVRAAATPHARAAARRRAPRAAGGAVRRLAQPARRGGGVRAVRWGVCGPRAADPSLLRCGTAAAPGALHAVCARPRARRHAPLTTITAPPPPAGGVQPAGEGGSHRRGGH
jgi:hypothetical protein